VSLTGQAFGDYFEGYLLSFLKGTTGAGTPFNGSTPPANLYVALMTANPADTGTLGSPSNGTEVTTTNGTTGWSAYARIAIASSGWSAIAAATGDSTGQQISNSAAIGGAGTAWQNGGGSSVTITGISIWDASTSGNLWFWTSLTSNQPVANGSAFSIGVAGIVIQVD
jgi:hypothetical protein